ncbi:DUF4372 domain-containing protein [Paenibacillus marinisediminis]
MLKKLTSLAYLKLFLYAQIQQRDSLREITTDVFSKDFQQELVYISINDHLANLKVGHPSGKNRHLKVPVLE